MGRVSFRENKYYPGYTRHSLQHLPRWYQITAIGGVFFVIYLRSNPVITWMVEQLHNSFGTEALWHPTYQALLRQMTFNERLCFTLYGVSLGLVVFLSFKFFCRDNYGLGVPAVQLFPDRKGMFAAIFISMCCVEAVRLRIRILECLTQEGSLANLAMHRFKGIEKTSFDPQFAHSNPHFVIQIELLKYIIPAFFRRTAPLTIVTGLYRLWRDVRRKEYVSLRWYLATFSCFSFLAEVSATYINNDWTNPLPVAMILWILGGVGTINYVYGPSKRAGIVSGLSTAQCVREGLKALNTCFFLWFVVATLVITVVVSVHVVELLAVWLGITLLMLWLPAIIDSGSLGFSTALVGFASYVACAMGYTSARGAARFGGVSLVWWLNVCMLYNVVVVASGSRYAGIAVLFWVLLYIFSPRPGSDGASVGGSGIIVNGTLASTAVTRGTGFLGNLSAHNVSRGSTVDDVLPTGENSGIVLILSERLRWLVDVVELRPLPANSWFAEESRTDPTLPLKHFAQSGLLTLVALVAALSLGVRLLSDAHLQRLTRHHIPVLRPGVLLRKAIRTHVVLCSALTSLLCGYVMLTRVLPRVAPFLPSLVTRGVSGVVSCVVLGGLMDSKDSMYMVLVRLLGLMDPPSPREGEQSSEEEEEDSPPGGIAHTTQ